MTRYPISASKHPRSLQQSSGIIILGASISTINSISPAIGSEASMANLFILAVSIGLKDEDEGEEEAEEEGAVKLPATGL